MQEMPAPPPLPRPHRINLKEISTFFRPLPQIGGGCLFLCSMDKYLFLDFDGVLNTEFYQDLLISKGEPWRDEHGPLFDPQAVEQLKRIIDATHADVVIVSSWKYLGLEAMQDMWEARHLPGRVIDITPSIVSASWSLDDNGLDARQSKGIEIDFWLFENAAWDTRYVIIDDEYVILDSQLPHFILANPFDGITDLLADRAIALLNG